MRILLVIAVLALLGGCDSSDKPKPAAGENGAPPPQDSGAGKDPKGGRVPKGPK